MLRNKKGALLDNNRLYLIIVFLFLIFFFIQHTFRFSLQIDKSSQAAKLSQVSSNEFKVRRFVISVICMLCCVLVRYRI